MPVPKQIQGQKYISVGTFRKDGVMVRTPVWFAEHDGKIYLQTRNDSWKYKRIRNNPQVTVAPCTARGKITGPEFRGQARILSADSWNAPRQALHRKYWLARLPFWSKKNEFLEIDVAS